MRRIDKEINDRAIIEQIISTSQVCRLGLAKDNEPYIIPVSFGYNGTDMYIHTAQTGKKIEFFEANPRVCLEFERGVTLKTHESDPCCWSFSFQSVVGSGVISELTEPAAMIEALHVIMKQYSEQAWTFIPENLTTLRVWKISIDNLTGKQSKDMMTP